MFHLLTSQVTFRKHEQDCITLSQITTVTHAKLIEGYFKLDTSSSDRQWTKFSRSVYHSLCEMAGNSINKCESVLIGLQRYMDNWTPVKSDIVVYTTVEEAYSGSVDDVEKFLVKLRLGEEGYPKVYCCWRRPTNFCTYEQSKTKIS